MAFIVKVRCPACRRKIRSDATLCSRCNTDLTSVEFVSKMRKEVRDKKIKIALILFAIIAIYVASRLISSSRTTTQTPATHSPAISENNRAFSDLARERFQEIRRAIPELESIMCENDNCTNGALFIFSTIPSDLDMIIRGNTATFSKFKMDTTGNSIVTIAALNNKRELVLLCQGVEGRVVNCK